MAHSARVLIIPGALDHPSELARCPRLSDSWSRSQLTPLDGLSVNPTAAAIGLDEATHLVAPGPLSVASRRISPPARSTCLRLDILSLDGGHARPIRNKVSAHEAQTLTSNLERLNTRRASFLKVDAISHALIWDQGSIDHKLWEPSKVFNQSHFTNCLPEGDGESFLRRLIDDSQNLLAELPINARRVDQGFDPLGIVWPWGSGFLPEVQPLSLLYGGPRLIQSESLDTEGYSWLYGLRHSKRRNTIDWDPNRAPVAADPEASVVVFQPQETTGLDPLDWLKCADTLAGSLRSVSIALTGVQSVWLSSSRNQTKLYQNPPIEGDLVKGQVAKLASLIARELSGT